MGLSRPAGGRKAGGRQGEQEGADRQAGQASRATWEPARPAGLPGSQEVWVASQGASLPGGGAGPYAARQPGSELTQGNPTSIAGDVLYLYLDENRDISPALYNIRFEAGGRAH